jgi:RHS repeat-associated protein
MYDSHGTQTWSCELSSYGEVRNITGTRGDCPFRYQGQYEDVETGLYYNRFRYYDPNIGNYLSQDPIGLAGGNPTLYGYVGDDNSQTDVFGLHLNTNAANGNFGVYEIRIDGELHKIGKADLNRVTESSGQPTRLHQQLRKLREQNPGKVITGEVVEEGFKTTANAKAAETDRLQKHFDENGEILEGNKKSFKPKNCD